MVLWVSGHGLAVEGTPTFTQNLARALHIPHPGKGLRFLRCKLYCHAAIRRESATLARMIYHFRPTSLCEREPASHLVRPGLNLAIARLSSE
ncbi:MAG: hypothetical protein DLM59_05315 [Pseudonocardiales bacterium]|nr:MAG: hypothetical protein DLM59_05315 [Pseudonocardiales bacterium]